MCVHLITQLMWLVGRLDPVNRFNNTSEVAVVTPTERPKSARNHYVTEVVEGVHVLSLCVLDFFFVGKGFCHRTELDVFLFHTNTCITCSFTAFY